ncbi:antibiotic biosynthesis monooxygenase [Candidatus Bipolaricaulota bacterium]
MVTHMHIAFRVEDYDQWKSGYDASSERRRAAGETSYQVFRDLADRNLVTVVSMQESAEGVQAFLDSPGLAEAMKASGVVEMGRVLLLEEVDRGVL